MKIYRNSWWLLATLVLAGCATQPVILPGHLPADAQPLELAGTPFIAQKRYQCGPAALAMVLQTTGVNVSADALVPKVYIPKLKGSLQAEMVAAARAYERLPYVVAPTLDALLAQLHGGRPVLVLENLGWDFYPVWHYAVVIGYLPDQDQLILRSGTTRRLVVDADDFMDDWGKAENWGLLVLKPNELPEDASPQRYLQAVAGLEAAGNTNAAAVAYTVATQRWPDQPAAWLGLGNTQYAGRDLAGAQRSYRRALKHSDNNPVVRNNLAQVLAEQGCKQAAQKQINMALAAAPESLQPALRETQADVRALPAASACRR